MELPLDRFTLEVVLVAVTGLMTLMMANVWVTNREEPGVTTWFLATVGGFIVFGMLTALETAVWGRLPRYGARNIATFLLALGILGGVMRFRGFGGPRTWRALAGVGVAFAGLMFTLRGDVRARLIAFDTCSIALMIGLAVTLAWRPPTEERHGLWFGTIAPLGLVGVLATRLWTTWHAGPDAVLPDPDAQNAVFLMTALFNITMTHTSALVLYQRAKARTERLAMEDPLTGLPNRRAFDERLSREISRSTRSHAPFALILADLNELKGVNDRHGHRAGDALLAAVGDRLRAVARETDVAARLGGDEFGILLMGVGDTSALTAAVQRVRTALEGEVACDDALPLDLRVSLGGALWGGSIQERDGLLSAADEALYADKARSRLATPTG